MVDATPWIEHINNPLVFFGFVLFVLASVVAIGKFTPEGKEKWLKYTFVTAIVVVVVGFLYSVMQLTPASTVIQNVTNNQGTAGQSVGDTYINSGGGTLSQKNSATTPSVQQPRTNLQQKIEGNTGVVSQSGGDSYIQAPEK